MLTELGRGPAVYRPSPFWDALSEQHLAELGDLGFGHFKRTVNLKYFNWRTLGIVRHQLSVVRQWARDPRWDVFRANLRRPSLVLGRSIGSLDPISAWIYKTFVAMYASLLGRNDPLQLLTVVQEPAVGDPYLVEYGGRDLSQDLCNSVHEVYAIFGEDGGPLRTGDPIEIAELGAGYGRLAYVVLRASDHVRYTIIDIPPALYLAQRYLTSVLPDLRAFTFRRFQSYEDVREEYEAARIRFVLPHQADLLPDLSFDYFINISSLHEMTRPQVERYFEMIDRVCRGRMYTKQWRVSRTPVNDVTFKEMDYPVPERWRTVYHRRHPIQSMFFHALYQVRSPGPIR